MHFPDTNTFARQIHLHAAKADGPYVMALDGRSGVGKSTLAALLAENVGAALIEGDDFFAGGTGLRSDSPAIRAADCIDWPRQRAVLDALRQGRAASWRAFDWEAFDGRLQSSVSELSPRSVVILEGVYSARPATTPRTERRQRRVPPRRSSPEPQEAREASTKRTSDEGRVRTNAPARKIAAVDSLPRRPTFSTVSVGSRRSTSGRLAPFGLKGVPQAGADPLATYWGFLGCRYR